MTSSFNPGGGGGLTGETVQFGASGVTLTDTYNGELLQATASGGVISFTAPTSVSQAKWMSVDPNSFTYSVNAASAPGTGVTAVWASGGTPSYSTAVPDAYWCVPVYGLGYWLVFPSAEVLSGYLVAANNLSDVASPATALANLGGSPETLTLVSVTASKTLALSDANTEQDYNSTSPGTITIPTNATVALPVGTVISYRQIGTGALTVAAAAGVTLNGTASPSAQYTPSTTTTQTAIDVWCVG